MAEQQGQPLFRQTDQPMDARIRDLIGRMELEEKVSQMIYFSSAIAHLDIPEYNWWNECLHGVGRAGIATVFPQAIGMAASFDPEVLHKTADIISDEARAKHHELARRGDRGIYKGLTFWSPTINIFRDPRWGRGQESYGEDPYLTGRLGTAFVKGLQGDHPTYMKVAACAKHYAVHSGPEADRHSFDAVVSEKDLRETYLPAFKDLVQEGKVEAVMGAYNRTNGEACCASPTLLQKILREEWGFDGHVVSDCGAIQDIFQYHKLVDTAEEAAALSVNAGCDLNCGRVFFALVEAAKQGLISEEAVDRSLYRLLQTRFRLGLFDPEDNNPHAQIPFEVVGSKQHRTAARQMARKSMVLLKNDNVLPLQKDLSAVAVIGPNAYSQTVLRGNYNGTSAQWVTALDGIRSAVSENTTVYYAEGCDLTNTKSGFWGNSPTERFAEALAYAERSDAVIMCMGISPDLEGEEGETANSDGSGDKLSLDLPGMQEELLKAVAALGKPVVLVLFNGSPVSINWAQDNLPAIVEAWYPGEEGGNALADILFGDYNPAGRLPVTFVRSLDQVPDFSDYSMKGRTYKYMEETPLYPFGFGLSYSRFRYAEPQLTASSLPVGEDLAIKVQVTNESVLDGEEVTQLYLQDCEASAVVPRWQLVGTARTAIKAGETCELDFVVTAEQMALYTESGVCLLEPGAFRLYVGGIQPDARSVELAGQAPQCCEFWLEGEEKELPL